MRQIPKPRSFFNMNRIQPGDMVMVVYGECEHQRSEVGSSYTVFDIVTADTAYCPHCSWRRAPTVMARSNPKWGVPLSWVIKVLPPGSTVDTEQEHGLTV